MKPILVHCHIYYMDMWDELSKYIDNITTPFDLYITVVKKDTDFENLVKSKYPNANIELVENKGYDVGPFIHTIKNVNLDNYSYVIKLHTKRNMPIGVIINSHYFGGDSWRKMLLAPISSQNRINEIINKLENTPKIGSVANFKLLQNTPFVNDERQKTREFLKKMNLPVTKQTKYIIGTMFITRASLLKPIQSLPIDIKDFEIPDSKHSSNMAHVFERLLSYIIYAQNKEIADVFTQNYVQILTKLFTPLRKIWRFVFQIKQTGSGKILVKILKIPVYNKKI